MSISCKARRFSIKCGWTVAISSSPGNNYIPARSALARIHLISQLITLSSSKNTKFHCLCCCCVIITRLVFFHFSGKKWTAIWCVARERERLSLLCEKTDRVNLLTSQGLRCNCWRTACWRCSLDPCCRGCRRRSPTEICQDYWFVKYSITQRSHGAHFFVVMSAPKHVNLGSLGAIPMRSVTLPQMLPHRS